MSNTVSAWVEILEHNGTLCEIREPKEEGKYSLCFQFCKYHYNEKKSHKGYRFIWRLPNGALQPARGQARIPSVADMLDLVRQALKEGWGHFEGEPANTDSLDSENAG